MPSLLQTQAETRASPRRWSTLSIALHWITVLLVVIAIGAIFARDLFDDRSTRVLLMNVHRSMGVCILMLSFIRVAVRCFHHRERADSRDWTDWTDWAAQGAHTVLYTLLFLIPVLGWALTNARGQNVLLFGLTLPRLVPEHNADLAYTLQDFHSSAAWILIALVVLHVVAALWHFFYLHDGVFSDMLPVATGERAARVETPVTSTNPEILHDELKQKVRVPW